jgi:hypothetical protein
LDLALSPSLPRLPPRSPRPSVQFVSLVLHQTTPAGLGWGTAEEEGTRDFWIETIEPIPLGLSWRPTTSATVKATIRQPGRSGLLYARYSADGAHWSSWQLMEEAKPRNGQVAVQEFRG